MKSGSCMKASSLASGLSDSVNKTAVLVEACNCDSGASRALDEGVLTSPLVGVTRVMAFRDDVPNQQSALTIGPLMCRGYGNAALNHAI